MVWAHECSSKVISHNIGRDVLFVFLCDIGVSKDTRLLGWPKSSFLIAAPISILWSITFGFRTIKLLSQKRRHLVVYFASASSGGCMKNNKLLRLTTDMPPKPLRKIDVWIMKTCKMKMIISYCKCRMNAMNYKKLMKWTPLPGRILPDWLRTSVFTRPPEAEFIATNQLQQL